MTVRDVVVQVARVPVLLWLLWTTAAPSEDLREAQTSMRMEAIWSPWVLLSALTLAFAVVVLFGRGRRHPWALLAVEAILAGVLAFVPPLQWLMWFSIGTISRVMIVGLVQPLAGVWLVVVAFRIYRQLRDTNGASAGPE